MTQKKYWRQAPESMCTWLNLLSLEEVLAEQTQAAVERTVVLLLLLRMSFVVKFVDLTLIFQQNRLVLQLVIFHLLVLLCFVEKSILWLDKVGNNNFRPRRLPHPSFASTTSTKVMLPLQWSPHVIATTTSLTTTGLLTILPTIIAPLTRYWLKFSQRQLSHLNMTR